METCLNHPYCNCPEPKPSAWFDRTVCPEPCGAMHYICETCGRVQS